MKLEIKTTNITLNNPLKIFIDEKILSLAKFLKDFEAGGDICAWLEIARTTKHHKKGDVFRAEADIKLPGKVLRAEVEFADLRLAIGELKNELQRQIKTYKTKLRQGMGANR